mmetsp:Transcript_3347/g.5076  ORF Transcript_3347/g.5076 Transcript_3347/m.5076 type:complete len:180 (+) Transcript_3347:3-542(+)
MASTGEVACFGQDVHHAFMLSLQSTGFKVPTPAKAVLVSIAEPKIRHEFKDCLQSLVGQGFKCYATPGTADFYNERGVAVEKLQKPNDEPAGTKGGVMSKLRDQEIGLLINIPEGTKKEDEITSGYLMRRAAVDFGCALITNIKCAIMLVEAMEKGAHLRRDVKSMEEYYGPAKTDIGI